MPTRRATPQEAAQTLPERRRTPEGPDQAPGAVGGRTGPPTWRLWFGARPVLPPALRGRTKSGKPKRPEPALPPNINERTRLHWRVERKLTAYWRGQAFALARAQDIPSCERVRVSAVIYRTTAGKADQSGDAERLKPLLDGLVDAGVVPDDTYRHVEHGGVSEVKASICGVELIVDVLAAGQPAADGEEGQG